MFDNSAKNYFVQSSAASLGKVSGPVVVVHVERGERESVVAVERVSGVAVVQVLSD